MPRRKGQLRSHRHKYDSGKKHRRGQRPKGVIPSEGPSPRRSDGKLIRKGNRVPKEERAKR